MLISDAKLNEITSTITPGPWSTSKTKCYYDGVVRDAYCVIGPTYIRDYEDTVPCEYDAVAIALVPDLISDLNEARERIRDLEWELENQ